SSTIVTVLSVPPVQSHHPPRGEPLARVRHIVDGDAHRILPAAAVLAASELARLQRRPVWQVVPVSELRPEPHPPLAQSHTNDPPRLASLDDAQAARIRRDRARVIPTRALPRVGNPGFALLDHRLSRGIYAREQCIPRAPVDAAIRVELGPV